MKGFRQLEKLGELDQLSKLGLSPYETKIYTALLEYGRMSARDISEKSMVPPTAVYPNLKRLVERNLVQELRGEVAFFEPLDPVIAIPAYIQKQKKSLDKVGNNLTEQAQKLFHHKQIVKVPEVLNVSLGKEASGQIYIDTLNRAKETYFVLGWTFRTAGTGTVKLHHLLEAQKKGVDIRVIVTAGSGKQWSVLEEFIKQGIKLRYSPLENFSLLIMDGKECKITLKDKKYPEKFNLHIHDAALAGALQNYFLTVWKKSSELNSQHLS